MTREGPARYRIAFSCDCGHGWSGVVSAEEAHRIRSATPPGTPVATGTAVTERAEAPDPGPPPGLSEKVLLQQELLALQERLEKVWPEIPKFKEIAKEKARAGLLVFLSAPVRPMEGETIESNLARVRVMYRRLCLHHKETTFLAPWILNCEVFSETKENIAAGMRRNERTIDVCDELWLLGNRLSKGMSREAKYARSRGKVVRAVAWDAVEAEEWKG